MDISTPDICDDHPDVLVLSSEFKSYGKRASFWGEIVTIKCFEDNSKVKELVNTAGEGKVLVVDGGGSRRNSLLGDQLALAASDNGWAGIVINGAVRDVKILKETNLGIFALGSVPRKTEKRGLGDVNVTIMIGDLSIKPGQYLYADENGVIISEENYFA